MPKLGKMLKESRDGIGRCVVAFLTSDCGYSASHVQQHKPLRSGDHGFLGNVYHAAQFHRLPRDIELLAASLYRPKTDIPLAIRPIRVSSDLYRNRCPKSGPSTDVSSTNQRMSSAIAGSKAAAWQDK